MRALYEVGAPAKLNLFLHVVGRRPDGYHLLESAFVLVDWADTLHFERRGDGRLSRHDLGAALPPDDLCLRAAASLQAASGTALGADIWIDKQVPAGAGLGGGSSDAASTLLALNRLWALQWPLARLAELGMQLGADVPFFLGGRSALVAGIGERLAALPPLPPQWFAVMKPPCSLATASVFGSPLVDRVSGAARIEGFTDGLQTGFEALAGFGRNDLQAAAEAQCPEVATAGELLKQRFGNSRMTGSGSAVFAWAGSGERPISLLPEPPAEDWQGRMCRSLAAHPLLGWAQ